MRVQEDVPVGARLLPTQELSGCVITPAHALQPLACGVGGTVGRAQGSGGGKVCVFVVLRAHMVQRSTQHNALTGQERCSPDHQFELSSAPTTNEH